MIDQGHLEDTVAHEMMHGYDHLRFKLDWANNLRHAACTEVREAQLTNNMRPVFYNLISTVPPGSTRS